MKPNTEPAREDVRFTFRCAHGHDSRAAKLAADAERERLMPKLRAGHITFHHYVACVMLAAHMGGCRG